MTVGTQNDEFMAVPALVVRTTPDAVVHAGIDFLRSITEEYGTDAGMQLWEKISEALPGDAKGDIFFALLAGDVGGKIRAWLPGGQLRPLPGRSNGDIIAVIKRIREVSGCGLKEAKDHADMMRAGNTVTIVYNHRNCPDARAKLREVGVECS